MGDLIEKLFSLAPLIVVMLVIINVIAKAKKSVEKVGRSIERDEETGAYKASPDEIRRFLSAISGNAPPPPQQRGPLGMPQGGVIPTAPRRAAQGAPQRRVPVVEAEEETTKRLVPDAEHLTPDIERHLRQRHLSGEQHSMEPTIEAHLRERHLDERQHSMEPTIEAHLKAAMLSEAPQTPAARRRNRQPIAPGAPAAVMAPSVVAPPTVMEKQGYELPEFTRGNVRRAIVMSEILGKPVALRDAP